jgi:hypothetical protein
MADLFALDPESKAVVSDCGTYRYRLDRQWAEGPKVAFVMLNPSTADAEFDDPTIRRCKSFARAWGFGGIVVGNLFALRSTNPEALLHHHDPIGPENNDHLIEIACEAQRIVCAWGVHGVLMDRGKTVRDILLKYAHLSVLRLTAAGLPGHPLYVAGNTRPMDWKSGDSHG